MSFVGWWSNYAVCSACQEAFPCRSQEYYPEGGWVLPFDTFGYYGGFSDNVDVLLNERRSREWILCHGCVVKFFETFPSLAESFGGGHHPCADETPCCQFAWQSSSTASSYEPDSETRHSFPDGKWHNYEPVE